MIELPEIKRQLQQHDCDVAENHLDQAISAVSRDEPESANAQLRAAVEALFDTLARVRIASTKTGGQARKELEEKGVLPARTARVVQSFIDYAGGSGSHAGRSSADEAYGRYHVALGLLLIGLDLFPNLVRVQDVLANLKPAPKDDQVSTTCRTCGTGQTLDQCQIQRDGPDTTYLCRNGCQVLIVVSAPGDSPWPGRGYRLGKHVIRNASDLLISVAGSPAKVLIPASPAALMKSRPPGDDKAR